MYEVDPHNSDWVLSALCEFLTEKYNRSPKEYVEVEAVHSRFFRWAPEVNMVSVDIFFEAVGLAADQLQWPIEAVQIATGQVLFKGLAVPQFIRYRDSASRKRKREAHMLRTRAT